MHITRLTPTFAVVLIASTITVFLSARASSAAPPQRAAGDAPPWSTARGRSGDTIVVRNTGTTSAAAELRLVEELRITGDGIPGVPGLSSVSQITHLNDGGLLLYEGGSRLILHFNEAGKFVRVIGGRGQGPGEYSYVRGIVQGGDGRIYVGGTYGDGHVYSQEGVYQNSWPAVVRGETATLMGVAGDGTLSFRTLISPRGRPDSTTAFGTAALVNAVFRLHPNNSQIDSLYAPDPAREQPTLPYGSSNATVLSGRTPTMLIPLVPYHISAYSRSGYWIGGDPETYTLTLHRSGAPLRIESTFVPVQASTAERQSLLDNHFYSVKARGSQLSTPLSIIPVGKPAFKFMETDADGRIWVQLHQPGVREMRDTIRMRDSLMRNQFTTVDGRQVPRPGAPVAPNRPSLPTDRWLEPDAYDIFSASGEFLGRLTLPSRASWGNAKGNRVWLVERDEFDVPTLVRYRVTAPAGLAGARM